MIIIQNSRSHLCCRQSDLLSKLLPGLNHSFIADNQKWSAYRYFASANWWDNMMRLNSVIIILSYNQSVGSSTFLWYETLTIVTIVIAITITIKFIRHQIYFQVKSVKSDQLPPYTLLKVRSLSLMSKILLVHFTISFTVLTTMAPNHL